MAGSLVQWIRDKMQLIKDAKETGPICESVDDTAGIYFVPAFSGLFAPYWRSDARGVIVGLTSYVQRAHIVRATIEATAYQAAEVCFKLLCCSIHSCFSFLYSFFGLI